MSTGFRILSAGFRFVNERLQDRIGYLTLQWHITVRCQNQCVHCYMYDELTYEGERDHPLSFDQRKQVLHEFVDLARSHSLQPVIFMTGGDPLLYERFWDLLRYANTAFGEPVVTGLMGNPDTVSVGVASHLSGLGVTSFQMSLEGRREMNDSVRGQGSFDKSLEAYDILTKAGIKVNFMLTLSKMNASELVPLIDVLAERGVRSFSFARATAFGKGRDLFEQELSTQDLRHLLLRSLERFRYWKELESPTRWGRKDPLYALVYDNLGLQGPEIGRGCCLIGRNSLCMLSDGTMLLCRRMPFVMGKWPEDSIAGVWTQAREQFEGAAYIVGCRDCPLSKDCRGCRAVFYGMTNDLSIRDLHCWRNTASSGQVTSDVTCAGQKYVAVPSGCGDKDGDKRV